jgi:hypothetical protein
MGEYSEMLCEVAGGVATVTLACLTTPTGAR